MTAKAKIEGLTHAWYGFGLVSSLVSLVSQGIGIFSIVAHAFGLMIGFVITYFIGRALVNKSSFVRLFLVVVSGVFTVLGVLGVARGAWVFLHEWSLSLLLAIGWACVHVYMNARSFNTLTDKSVKAYFG